MLAWAGEGTRPRAIIGSTQCLKSKRNRVLSERRLCYAGAEPKKGELLPLIMRFHPKRVVVLTLCIASTYLILFFYNYVLKNGYSTSILRDNINYFHPSARNLSCRRPELDIDDPALAKFFTPNEPIECDAEADWVCHDRGVAYICNDALKRHRNVSCKYTFLNRISDYSTVASEVVDGGSGTVALKSDFFKVSCVSGEGIEWSNIMAGVRFDSFIHDTATWAKLNPFATKLNVLIWGFDSLSHNTFIRKLPKTHSYLTNTLGSIVLNGYNIIGDGTPQALIPILTGKLEQELPETRWRKFIKSHFVNVYPLIWKDFASQGYVTAFGEDNSNVGTFTYRLKGFDEQPTDHYLRTFYVAAEPEYSNHKHLCLRGTPRHKVMMNWVRDIFTMYSKKPKFLFTFHNELSHDDYNLVGAADDDLLEMIKTLKDQGYLDNTVLILMSDHGHRFAGIRELQQGRQEERLPYFSFTFPSRFKKKYPQAMDNFKKNENRLTTPFDIYPTLRNILDMTYARDNLTGRSISLFNEIPTSRTCRDAHIDAHWCTCLDWKTVSNEDETVVKAVATIINFFNSMTQSQRNLCSSLKLDKIVWAGKFIPTRDLMHFRKSSDYDGVAADLSSNMEPNIEFYQLKFHTKPGGGHFEVSLKFDSAKKMYRVKKEDISRTNKYGSAADCIKSTHEHLRKFCYCKTKKNATRT